LTEPVLNIITFIRHVCETDWPQQNQGEMSTVVHSQTLHNTASKWYKPKIGKAHNFHGLWFINREVSYAEEYHVDDMHKVSNFPVKNYWLYGVNLDGSLIRA